MIGTYHLIFQITLVISIVLLIALIIYCIVFRVGYAISWLTGYSKKKEMRNYNPSEASAELKKQPKKADAPRKKQRQVIESEGSFAVGVPSKPQSNETSKKPAPKSNVAFAGSGTDVFDEVAEVQSNTDVFSMEEKDSIPTGTDIFEEITEPQKSTDIFEVEDEPVEKTQSSSGTDIFEEPSPTRRDTEIFFPEEISNTTPGTEILDDEEDEDDDIFLSVGNMIGDIKKTEVIGTDILDDIEA